VELRMLEERAFQQLLFAVVEFMSIELRTAGGLVFNR
jgi:hypothetical protein